VRPASKWSSITSHLVSVTSSSTIILPKKSRFEQAALSYEPERSVAINVAHGDGYCRLLALRSSLGSLASTPVHRRRTVVHRHLGTDDDLIYL
jgi:hypothetical protein